MDLTVEVPALPPDALSQSAAGESSASVRARVVSARARQQARYGGERLRTNAELTSSLMTRHCAVERDGMRLLESAIRRMALSARGYDRVRKVARTIADLADCEAIGADHIAEVLQFRII